MVQLDGKVKIIKGWKKPSSKFPSLELSISIVKWKTIKDGKYHLQNSIPRVVYFHRNMENSILEWTTANVSKFHP